MPFRFLEECDYDLTQITDYWLYEIDYEYPEGQIIVNLPTRIEDEIVYIRKKNI